MTRVYYKQAVAAVIVFDLTKKATLDVCTTNTTVSTSAITSNNDLMSYY